MAPADSARWQVPVALAIVYVVWGSTYFAIRVALQGGFTPFVMAGVRFLVAGGLLFALARLRGEPIPTRVQWINAAKMGLLLLVCGNGLVVTAEQWVASGLTAVLIASVTLWSTLFEGLLGTWPNRRQWLGLAVGLSGIVLLNVNAELRGSALGVGLLLFSAAAWAFGSVWSRKWDLPKGAMASAAEMLTGGAVLATLAFLHGERLPAAPSQASVLAVLYLILFGSIVAFSAYLVLIRRASSAVSTSYAYVNPAVAVLLGVTFGAEQISPLTFAALGVILSGVVLVAMAPKSSR